MPAIIQDTTVLAKCDVLYIGSAVPLESTKGIEALQQPLRERYPVDNEAELEGIDALITVTHSHIEMRFASDATQIICFPISSMTICAAVRCIVTGQKSIKFASLNSQEANAPANARRPAIFSTIIRRSQGRKVLECHSFICRSARDALNLVKMTSYAGNRLKGRQTLPVSIERPIQVQRPTSNVYVNGTNAAFNRTSVIRNSMTNGNVGQVSSMHLTPAAPIVQTVKPGREFYEPVNTQGYFYSSDKTEVKKFHIENINNNNNENGQASLVIAPAPAPPVAPIVIETQSLPPTSIPNGSGAPSPTLRPQAQPQPQVVYIQSGPPPRPPVPVMMGPRPPMMMRMPMRPMMRPPPPFMYGPRPPQMVMRPRFFSPPPPRMRPMPYMVPPPGAPPPGPIMAPPVYMRRRPRRHSHSSDSSDSGSRSRSGSRRSKSSRRNDENTAPNVVPNGDANTSSEDETPNRPGTPPKDYNKMKNGKRLSRREEFEMKERFRRHQPQMDGPYGPPPGPMREMPSNYDYYVYPPRHGGYEPFMMHNPHLRSRSVPPQMRQRSKSPRKKNKKKHKKNKKEKKRKGLPRTENISEDSYAGYHSEIPLKQRGPDDSYMMYPPRDFRRADRQFMNERNFSKSIQAEERRSKGPDHRYPTAYELNESMNRGETKPGEPDFNMY